MKQQILALRAEGKTYKQITEELGCSKGLVAHYVGAGVAEKALVRQRDKRNTYTKLVQKIKTETPCTDCGENYPYYVMEFDHLPEFEKKFNISMLGKVANLRELQAEIAKCEVVCSNCHKIRTRGRMLKTGNSILWDN